MRSRKAALNSMASLILEVVSVLCGLILPRFILTAFGSDYNGITSSVSHFLAIITLLRSGVGGVTRASLYKPLADNDIIGVSRIVIATEKFLRKVALIFSIGLVAFAAAYPFVVIEDFDWLFSFVLVLILGAGSFVQYYFGLTYQLLLLADQRNYIYTFAQAIAFLLNLAISIVLIKLGCSFLIMKLVSSSIFALTPLFLHFHVKRRYALLRNVEPDTSAIKQRWDAFGQQIANYITTSTDTIVLTIMVGVKEVSVYSIYSMVAVGIERLITSITSGLDSAFGNMLARGEKEAFQRNFRIYELVNFSLSTFLYSCTFVLLSSFVALYTKGVTDISYDRPLFCALIVMAEYSFCLRLPYKAVTYAAGHYKQTKRDAYFEAGINAVSSIILAYFFGLEGVAIGTILAVSYRTVTFAVYLSKNILHRPIKIFLKNMFVFFVSFVIIVALGSAITPETIGSFLTWVVYGIVISVLSIIIIGIVVLVLYRDDFENMLAIFKNGIIKRKTKKSGHNQPPFGS